MKQTKSSNQKQYKNKRKNIKQIIQNQKNIVSQHPLQKTVILLQQDVIRLQNTIDFYRKQVQQLEQLNLELYQKLQESKIKEQNLIRSSIIQLDIAQHKQKELCSIISKFELDQLQLKAINQEMQKRCEQLEFRIGKQQELRQKIRQLQEIGQKYKRKLLESQKYWITRIECVIGEKRNENEKVIKQMQQQHQNIQELLRRQIMLKDKAIRQKTQQIYKLITHIRGDG